MYIYIHYIYIVGLGIKRNIEDFRVLDILGNVIKISEL